MKRFVPREKMSKRQRRKLDAERRTVWQVDPATKVVQSKKIYNRKKQPRNYEPYDPEAVFLCFPMPASDVTV